MANEDRSKSDLLMRALGLRSRRKNSEVTISSDPPSPVAEKENIQAFRYSALDTTSKSIRLLEVQPGRDFESIKAKIDVCDLNRSPNERPPYIALSYKWDQGGNTRHIECNGSRIEVGENLWQFLQHYRRSLSLRQQREEDPSTATRIWIDALSINQDDIQERGHQVALMRDIYTGADSVIVWLGVSQSSEELAFMLTRHPGLLSVKEMMEALTELLNKPYWRRVWVVQEFVLARSVDIWCGDHQANAKAFEDVWRGQGALLPYQISQNAGMHLFQFRKKHRNTAKIKRDTLGRRNSKTFRSTRPLRELLETFDGAQSTLSYDKIYGFLGIATEGHGGRIVPNYSLQPVELLVAVLCNQCSNTTKAMKDADYRFLTWLMRTLRVSRAELIQHVMRYCPEAQQHLFVLTVSDFVIASVSFISTVQDVGLYMEEAEARMPSTWRPKWLQTSMHPNSLTKQDLQDIGQAISTPEIAITLEFADAHVPGRPYIGTASARGTIISNSTGHLISQILEANSGKKINGGGMTPKLSTHRIREALSNSLLHSAQRYDEARPELVRRYTGDGLERYISFKGTNGYIGLVCVKDAEIFAGDRICTFAGITDSNRAFVVRLRGDGRWAIVGFAIVVLPPDPIKAFVQRADSEGTMINEQPVGLSGQLALETDRQMCFHCHLADLLELQRCRILNDVQLNLMLDHTLRLGPADEVHQCSMGEGKLDVLEFGG